MMNITKEELQEKVDSWVNGENTIKADQILWILDFKGWELTDDCKIIDKT